MAAAGVFGGPRCVLNCDIVRPTKAACRAHNHVHVLQNTTMCPVCVLQKPDAWNIVASERT